MRYVLDFGSANAGGAPTFTVYKRLDTLADLAQPTIAEIGGGQYYFEIEWSAVAATSITFKATLAGIELSDVVSSPSVELPGATVASAGISSTSGYSTAATLLNRAAVHVGLAAATDPFASTDASFALLREHLDALGMELATELKAHLHREFSLTTAGGASSYALPADYVEMVDEALWDRADSERLVPVSAQDDQRLKAELVAFTTDTLFRLQGNRITFPIVPEDGRTFTGLYVSRYWVQTAASGTGPDADHATGGTDYVLFDPLLVVYGLRHRFLESKGFDTAAALDAFQRRLQWAKGQVAGGRTLSLGGHARRGTRFLSTLNLPDTIAGI